MSFASIRERVPGFSRPRAWSVRTRLTVALVLATAVSFALLTAAFWVVLRHETRDDAGKVLVARATSELRQILNANNAMAVGPILDFAQAGGDRGAFGWIFLNGQLVERPSNASTKETLAAARLMGKNDQTRDADDSVRIYSLSPKLLNGATLTVVSGVQLGPYSRSIRYALLNLGIVGLLLLALVASGARFAIRTALKPVTRMARQARSWSSETPEERFAVGPPTDEFGELAETFDGLLDGILASLRHEERFSAEVSHELRTPLAAVIGEAQLSLRAPREPADYQDTLRAIEATGQQMLETLETLLTVARGGSVTGTVSDLGVAAQSAADDAALVHPDHAAVVLHLPEERVMAGVDAEVVRRILAPVINNAYQYGAPPIELWVERSDDMAIVRIADAGPGLTDQEIDSVFEPGFQGSAHRDGDLAGAGLGLALTRRLARVVGGDATAEAPTEGVGARFVISLPPA